MPSLLDAFSLLLSSAFLLFVLNGRRRLRRGEKTPDEFSGTWPPVAVVVVTNDGAAVLSRTLPPLMRIDYPDYELIFVTESPEEEAATCIDDMLAQLTGTLHGRRLTSGKTVSGCQKNHNMLQGIAAIRTETEILAFVDSTHIVPGHWLKSLVRPLVENSYVATTGYHRILPAEGNLFGLGRAVSVLTLYLAQLCPPLTMLWGGNLAIRKDAYDQLDIGGLWRHNISEDTSASLRFKRLGRPFLFVCEAEVTDVEGVDPGKRETFSGWFQWTARQWLNVKFIDPWSWLLGGSAFFLFLFALFWTISRLVYALIPPPSWTAIFSVLLSFLLFGASACLLKCLHGKTCPLLPWLASAFLAAGVGAASHATGWFTHWIEWSGRRYHVIGGGQISEIVELDPVVGRQPLYGDFKEIKK